MIPRAKHLRALILGAALGAGLVVTSFAPQFAVAQADLGSVSGTVTDASGAYIPKAAVTVTNNATAAVRNSSTNSKGEYAVTQLNPGLYTVAISAPGFAPAAQTVSVTVGSSNTVSAKLAVSGGKTEVVVQADNFAGVQLDKPEVSAVIETDQILSLPTLDRDPYSLVAFSGNLSSDPTASSRGVGFNIAGARSSSVDILLDGVENTDMYAVAVGQTVPLDATSEIRIVTSNSGAEYGRGSGAVNVSTKSGTNQFHGSVYEFNRVSTLGSDGFNNNYIHAMEPDVTAKPRYTHNQFGYSVGGPVKKDKLFFFSSTEWTRIRSAQNVIAVVPTDTLINTLSNQRTRDFFSTYGTLSKPINGAKYKGNSAATQKIFASDISTIAQNELGLTYDDSITSCSDSRIADTPICTSDLFGESIYTAAADSGGGAPINQWISFNRADWTINQTTSLFGRYIQQSSINPAGYINNSPYKGYDTGQTQYNRSLELSLTKAFSQTLASATKLLGSRLNNSQPLSTAPKGPTLYVNGSSNVSLGGGTINFPGYSQTNPGNSLPFGGPQNFIEIGEDLTWSKGKHQFSFGGNFLYIKDNRTFGAYETAVDGLTATGAGGALVNFVGGGMNSLQVAIDPKGAYPCSKDASGSYIVTSSCEISTPVDSPNFSRSNRYQDGAAYANDSFKLSPRFTLSLGLRWELYGPQHSQKASYDSNFFFGTGDTVWDQIRNGGLKTRETSPNGRLWNLNKKQFAPKVGFAFDPYGNGKTSIRGGFGISYERNFNNVTFNVIQNPPNYAVVSFTAKSDNNGSPIPISTNNFAQYGTSSGVTKALPNVNLRAVDPNIKPAYANNWSLSVEQQFSSTTASLSYVGTRGIHNYTIANINRVFDGSTYLGDARTANRTNYQYGSINFRGADGDSYYNGLTAELRSSNLMGTGLTIRGDYTFSHSIDNNSSTFGDSANVANGGLVLGYTDPFNHDLDRGNSDFDQTHRVAAAIIWAIPYAKRLTGVSKLIADNWTLATTFDAQTGTPFTMFDCSAGYNVCVRPSFVNKPSRTKTRDMADLSKSWDAPNTYSYLTLPDFTTANYNEQINPNTGTSDTPICAGLHGTHCTFVKNMDGRNAFRSPGSWNENLGIIKDFKVHERYAVQLKGEFINVFNHANTFLNLGGTNDVASYTDVLAYKNGNRKTELSLHFAF